MSHSLIHQAERGKRVPSYPKAKRIADFLDGEIARRLKNNGRSAIGDICCWKLVKAELRDAVDSAIELMLKGDNGDSFSQLPVFDKGRYVGAITGSSLMKLMMYRSSAARHRLRDHRDAIVDAYHIVDEKMPLDIARALIEKDGALLVLREGWVEGIATAWDFLGLLREPSPKARRHNQLQKALAARSDEELRQEASGPKPGKGSTS